MKKTVSWLVPLLVLAFAFPAQAQLFRTYLASYGNDANPCTVVQPCRLLPAAIDAVAQGGEVWILDSANFNQGTVDIEKPVSILVVPGKVGSIVAVNHAPAITITANVSVGLRNVVIADNANNHGTDGIVITAGSGGDLLSVEDSVFVNLQGNGIRTQDTIVRVAVKNTVFRNNLGYAVLAENGSTVEVADSRLFGNLTGGVAAFGGSDGTTTVVNVTDSTIACGGSPALGVLASTTTTATVKAMITRTTIHDCGFGVEATAFGGPGNALVVLSNSAVSGNQNGFSQGAGGTVVSLGNNYIGDNSGADIGTLTTSATR